MSEPASILHFPSEPDPAPQKRRSKRLPLYLTDGEFDAVVTRARFEVEEAHTPIKLLAARRDEVVLHLGLHMGLRLSEFVALDVDHLDLLGRRCRIMHGKGDKDRIVPIPVGMVDLLRSWIGERRQGPMFPSNYADRGRIDDSTIGWRMERLGILADMTRRLKPHTLRHTAAVRLLRKCKNIMIVKEFLGHRDVSVTQVYTEMTVDDVAAAIDAP